MAADEARLAQLFRNLVENTALYRPRRQPEDRHPARGRRAVHRLSRLGLGVPDTLLPRLFERFFRGEASRNRATGGSGLGLAICRSIVEAHDGSISAHPSPLGGVWVALRFTALED